MKERARKGGGDEGASGRLRDWKSRLVSASRMICNTTFKETGLKDRSTYAGARDLRRPYDTAKPFEDVEVVGETGVAFDVDGPSVGRFRRKEDYCR